MPRQEEAGATEEATVSWQEKVLSQREIQLYGDLINCNTVRERHYHEYALTVLSTAVFIVTCESITFHDFYTKCKIGHGLRC